MADRLVAGDLLVVGSETVSCCVGITEHACVEHEVGGRSNTRNHCRWRKGSLFNVLEVVGGVFVEGYLANLAKGVFLVRPGEGVVENVDARGFCFIAGHDLEVHVIFREVSALNRIVEVLDVVIGIFASETECLICVKILNASFGLDVPFDVYKGAILLAELVCVYTESVDVAELGYLVSTM